MNNQLHLSNGAQSTTITGPAAGVSISGNHLSRVFLIDGGATVSLQALTIANGNSNGAYGGGINNNNAMGAGTLTLTNVTVSGNTAPVGGGIYNSGCVLILNNVALAGNTAPGSFWGDGTGGGGMTNDLGGTATLTDVTISGNSVYNAGGGIVNAGNSTMILTNVTVSGNSASVYGGGGIFNSGTLTATNVTVSGNTTGGGGGGIANMPRDAAPGIFNIENSIVAGNNLSGGGSGPDANGSFNSLGYNLVGQIDPSTGWNATDLKGTIAAPIDAKLGALGDNGGPTQTMLPLTGSPAIDHGLNTYIPSGITADQRGLPRIANGTVDIGAVEAQPNQPPIVTVPGAQTLTEDADLTIGGITVADSDAGSGVIRLTMSVLHGTLNVRTDVVGGVTSVATSGNGTASVTLTTTLTAINATLAAANGSGYRGLPDYNGSDTLTVTADDQGNTGSGGAKTDTKTVAITLTPVNDVPFFANGSSPTVPEDTGPQNVSGWATGISAGPANEAGQSLNFLVSNDNTALFLSQPAISPAGVLTYTPAANANGAATVTVRLHDNGGTTNSGVDTSASQTFTITVTPVNDAPLFAAGSAQMVLEDAGVQIVSNWATAMSAGPADEAGQALNFLVSNDNTGLFSVQPAISPAGVLTYTPAANANGAATVTVRLHDNGGTTNGGADTSAALTFTITVTPVNDVPSFSKGPNQAILKNSGAQTASLWATGMKAGPTDAIDEAGQTLGFLVSNDNTTMFSVQPALSASGTLTYVPAPNAAGVATVTVRLQDNGGTANGGVDTSTLQTFTITVYEFPASVSGQIYNDANADGLRGKKEKTMAGQRVFLDADDDNQLDANESSQLTDAKGRYSFAGLVPGWYCVRAKPAKAWRVGAPIRGQVMVLASGDVVTGKDIGLTQMAQVSGTVFNDANGNKIRETSEASLARWTVFVDSDNDGVMDKTELSARTDSLGHYSLNLAAGSYLLRVSPKTGWKFTTPKDGKLAVKVTSGQSLTGPLIGCRQ